MIARRGQQIAAVSMGALLVASGVAVVKPRDYRAETTLGITASGALTSDQLQKRVDGLTREIVAPHVLQGVVTRMATNDLGVEQLRARTHVSAAPAEEGGWVVTIEHEAPDAGVAARVVELLASDYQWSAAQKPIVLQEEMVAVQERRLETAKKAFDDAKDELDRYVLENQSYLEGPEQRLATVRDQIGQLERAEIASYESEVERLNQLLDEEPEVNVETVEVRDEERIAALRSEIRDVQAEITTLQAEQGRTDADPLVISKRRLLLDLKEELTRVEADVTKKKVETPNEMYASLVQAKVSAESDLASARRKLSVLRTTEAEILDEVRRAPDLRAERDRLTHAAEAAQEDVAECETALAEAKAKLADVRQERPLAFHTIAPPEAPRNPTGPGALTMAGIGLLLGGLLGLGAAYVVDARDRSFRDPTRVSSKLGLPTLGAIHAIRTTSEEDAIAADQRRSTSRLLGIGLLSCVLLVFAVLGDATPIQDLVRTMLR